MYLIILNFCQLKAAKMRHQRIKIYLSILFFIFLGVGFIGRIIQGNTHQDWLNNILGLTAILNILTLALIVLIDVPSKFRTKQINHIVNAIFYLFFGIALIGVALFMSYQEIKGAF
jgi:hypothetical protein